MISIYINIVTFEHSAADSFYKIEENAYLYSIFKIHVTKLILIIIT